jgi:O-succinylbenzoic acid--CoA ligase
VAVVKDLVALDLPAGSRFREELERAWSAGDAVFPLDRRLPVAAAERVLRALRVGMIVTAEDRIPTRYGKPVEEVDALVVASSGTGGDPKAAVLTHDAVRAAAFATSNRLAVDTTADRWLACLPLSHVGGLGVVTRAVITGTALEIHDGFDPVAVHDAASRGATLVSLVETALGRIDASRFRAILVGGSAVRLPLPDNAVATYGMTESGGGVVYGGRPLDGVEVRVAAGEVQVRGPMLLRAYRDGTDPKDPDGWFATGDAGRFDHSGALVVEGRIADVIVTGGEKVLPGAVEAVLAGVPGVGEVAVVGRPDPEWGEAVTAVVVPADRAEPPALETLREAVKATLPAYAAPRRLEIVDHLPRTSLGKVRRAGL